MSLELKIPPAIVTGLVGCLMWSLDTFISIGLLSFPGSFWIAMIFLLAGGIFGVLGLIQFYREATSIDPHNPQKASSLVTGGIYRLSRNPMYVALLLSLIGFGVYLQNLLALLLVPLFVWYMNRFQIKPEEEVLMNKFGEEYRSYLSQVRRWL